MTKYVWKNGGTGSWMWPTDGSGKHWEIPGVVPHAGRWFVWPQEPYMESKVSNYARTQPSFDTREQAMAACRLIYG